MLLTVLACTVDPGLLLRQRVGPRGHRQAALLVRRAELDREGLEAATFFRHTGDGGQLVSRLAQ